MGWAEKLPTGKWRAVWRDASGVKHSLSGYRTEAAATRAAGERESKRRRGEITDDGRAPTWGQWCPIWQSIRTVEPSTAEVDRLRIARYLEPQWGQRRLNKITRSEVQAWVNRLPTEGTRPLAPASVEKVYRLFSASMRAAVKDESVPLLSNPCADVTLPVVAPGHERFLERGEVDLIAYHLNEPYKLAVLLAAGTGMRWGELSGLHWQRVDLGAGLVDIVETWDPTAKRIKPYPKGKRRRAVPIPPWLAVALSDALDRLPADAGTCGQDHAPGGARCRSRLVITGPQGGPLNGRNFGRRDWSTACQLAGVDRARLHDIRHAYASWLVRDGVSLAEVQRLLGHRSSATTERYSHLGQSQNERVLAALT